MVKDISLFLAVFIASYGLTFFFRKMSMMFGVMDRPEGHKAHSEPVPLLGGAAVYTAVIAGVVLNVREAANFLPVIYGATLLMLAGLVDDVKQLSVRVRLVIQLIASGIVIYSGIRITFLPTGAVGNLAEIIITLIWLVGVTNAYNYLDGLNGLATGSCVINSFFFYAILKGTSQTGLGSVALMLLAASLGFLPHNFKKAKIFLGDSGSNFLGFMLAGMALAGTWAQDNIVKISIPILILGVPIFDMIFTTIMRVSEKKVKTVMEWMRYCGRDHFHHYLMSLGFHAPGAVFFIWALTVSLGLSAVMVSDDAAWEGILALLQASILLTIAGILIVVGRRHNGQR